MIKAVTGLELTQESLKSIARTISDGTRRFNLQEGLTPLEDRLPKRFTTEALPETGQIITEDQMRQLLADYYKARGWDENGTPPEKID
jgi:aldehyde:ferredoxin oxidoreductase